MNAGPWHLGVLAAFDLETTGVDVETARIVTACVAHIDGSGVIPPESENWLIDPGMDIPAEATAVHGITTEHAREYGQPAARALKDISGALTRPARAGVPIVAYNAPFDLTVMDRETRRNDLDPFGQEITRAFVIDPLVLDKHLDPFRKGRRDLTAACGHYGVRLDGAHTAEADAIAAARVAWKLANVYPQIAAMTLPDLHELQMKAKADQAASFQDYLRKQGKPEVIDGSWPIKAWTEAAQ